MGNFPFPTFQEAGREDQAQSTVKWEAVKLGPANGYALTVVEKRKEPTVHPQRTEESSAVSNRGAERKRGDPLWTFGTNCH